MFILLVYDTQLVLVSYRKLRRATFQSNLMRKTYQNKIFEKALKT